MFSFNTGNLAASNALSTPVAPQQQGTSNFPQPAANTQQSGSYTIQPSSSSYSVPATANANTQIALDTPYMKLPAKAREEIDQVFDKFKKPSREYLADVADQKEGFMDDISESLKAANLLLLRNENKQMLVRHDLSALRDDAMQVCAQARKSGHSCLEEVRQYGTGRLRKSDHAAKFQANEFFLAAFARLAKRLEMFAEEAARIEHQLVSMQAIASRKRESFQDVGMYGEPQKIGLNELVQLIKHQHAAFLAVTAQIAECHRDADHLRAAFKKCFPSYETVFDDEDRREAADGRMSSIRVKEQFREHLLMEARGSQVTAAGGKANNGTQGSSNAFYAPVNSSGAAAPTGTFGSTNTAAPASSTTAFGSFGVSPATGAAPASNGFGTFGGAQPAATNTSSAFGAFGTTQPTSSAGDLMGVGMNRSFSTTFGSVGGTTGASDSKSKSRNRRNK